LNYFSSYTITGLPQGVAHYIRVRAINKDNIATLFTSTFSGTPNDNTVPGQITVVALSSTTVTSYGINATLQWTSPGNNGAVDALEPNSEFWIWYSTNNPGSYNAYWSQKKITIQTYINPGTQVIYTISGLLGGTTWYFRVFTKDETGNLQAVGTLAQSYISAWSNSYVTNINNTYYGQSNSIITDSLGRVHIAFTNDTNHDIYYVMITSGIIGAITPIETSGDFYYATISISTDNKPVIVYVNNNPKELRFARYTDSGWDKSTVEIGGTYGFGYCSVVMSRDNVPYISYGDETYPSSLKCAYLSSPSSWTIQLIDSYNSNNYVNGTQIALNSNGYPKIVYNCTKLKFADWDGIQWTTSTIDNSGTYGSLIIDANNNPHVSYYVGLGIQYTKRTNGTWNATPVETSVSNYPNTVIVDGNNNPIVFYNYNSHMYYAIKSGASWIKNRVDPTETSGYTYTGYYALSAVFDALGSIHCAYDCYYSYSYSQYMNVKYAKWVGTNFTPPIANGRNQPILSTYTGYVYRTNGTSIVSGATVKIKQGVNVISTGETNTNGYYSVSVGQAGVYDIVIEKTDFISTGTVSVNVNQGEVISRSFRMVSNKGFIDGTVTRSDSGSNMSGAIVSAGLTPGATDSATVSANENGSYSLTVNAGTYYVTVTGTDYTTVTTSYSITVQPDQTFSGVNITAVYSDASIPGSIGNLIVFNYSYSDIDYYKVTLNWASSGNNGPLYPLEPGSKFIIRYSTGTADLSDTGASEYIITVSQNLLPGTTMSQVITNLYGNLTYKFRIYVRDQAGNYSTISDPAVSQSFPGWITSDVSYDSSYQYTFNQIAVDSQKRVHAVFYSNGLRYASLTNGVTTVINTIDTVGVQDLSLAVDGTNKPHVVWTDGTTLKYAKFTDSGWDITQIYSDPNIYYCSLAIDKDGYPHIVYAHFDYSIRSSTYAHQLKYVKQTQAGWSDTVRIVSKSGYYYNYGYMWLSMALNKSGYPGVAVTVYNDNSGYNDVIYYEYNGATWTNSTVNTNVQGYVSSVIDSSGNPHIVCLVYQSPNYKVKYAKRSGSSWNSSTNDDSTRSGFQPYIAVDGNNNPIMSYVASDYSQKYALLSGGVWQPVSVYTPSQNVGGNDAFCLDTFGTLHFLCKDYLYISGWKYWLGYSRWLGTSFKPPIANGRNQPIQSGVIGYVKKNNDNSVLAGVSVEVYQAGTLTLVNTGVTDAAGAYNITIGAAGVYDITAKKTDYVSQSSMAVSIAGDETKTINFSLVYTKGLIYGRVTSASAAVPNASVLIYNAANSVLVSSGTTNSTGDYSVNVETGTYNIVCKAKGYKTTSTNGINVILNQAVPQQDFALAVMQSPTVVSATHPDPATWYSNGTVTASWNAVTDAVNYYWVCDNAAATDPTPSNNVTASTTTTFAKTDGVWYFHVAAVETGGGVSDTKHFTFRIDTTVPGKPVIASATHPKEDFNYASPIVQFTLSPTANEVSGVSSYYYLVDTVYNTIVTTVTGTVYTSNALSYTVPADGTYYLHVIYVDLAGNVGVLQSDFKVNVKSSVLADSDNNLGFDLGEVTIPAGAVNANDKLIAQTPAAATIPQIQSEMNTIMKGTSWYVELQLQSGQTQFNIPITIKLSYNPVTVTQSGLTISKLKIAFYSGGKGWSMLSDSVVDTTSNTVTATVNHFTLFRIVEFTPATAADKLISELYNYPNPFSPESGTTIRYVVADTVTEAKVKIFNIYGELIKDLKGTTYLGTNDLAWDGKDENGSVVTSDVFVGVLRIKDKDNKEIVKRFKLSAWK
jgi:hypothetical protein